MASPGLSLMVRRSADARKKDALRKSFKKADVNGDGFLTVDEYIKVFQQNGVRASKQEVERFFRSKDRDKDGRISYQEFCGEETTTEKAFRAMDLNSDGFVAKSEMLQVTSALRRQGRRLSAADLEACFHEYDRDKNDKLDFAEFCDMMNHRRRRRNSTGGAVAKLDGDARLLQVPSAGSNVRRKSEEKL